MSDEFHTDYPTEPIGGGNPYYRCVYCKRSEPEINGRIEGHTAECEYRRAHEASLQLSQAVNDAVLIGDLGALNDLLHDTARVVISDWEGDGDPSSSVSRLKTIIDGIDRLRMSLDR